MFSSPNTWVNYAFVGISGFGFAANFKGFKYITQTFNVRDNLFNILALDALTTTILNGLYSISSLIMIVNRDFFKTKLTCASFIIIGFLPCVTGPFTSFLISLRRFVGMKYPHLFPRNSHVINVSSTVSRLVVIAYYVILVFLKTFLGSRSFNFVQLCLDQPEDDDQTVMLLGVICPNVALIVIAIALDYATKVKINQVEDSIEAEWKNKATERKRRDKIATRAIYINVGLFLPWLLYSVVVGKAFDLTHETHVILMTLPNLLVDALRNPIIARFAFQVNQAIQKETFEDRRTAEIQNALRKREQSQPKIGRRTGTTNH